MLRELHISGLGVIEDITLELAPGLNVLTGETGAGKTMVTVGLALALGRRSQAHLVRSGRERTGVQARFEVEGFEEWADEGDLVLARSVAADGKSTARAGGQLAPLATLADLGADLVEVHGQHQTQRLLSPAAHLEFLDRFAGPAHLDAVAAYRDVHARLREARRRLDDLDARAREREREIDLLAYQVGEIEAVGLDAGEITQLQTEESRLAHAEQIRPLLGEARGAPDGAGADAMASAAGVMERVAELDPDAGPLAARLRSLAEEARDAAAEVRARGDRVELDPARLEAVRDRIQAIHSLERKYGEGEYGVLAYLAEARSNLETLRRGGGERDGFGAGGGGLC